MPAINLMSISLLYATSFAILLLGFLTALSSKDLIRLLIALEPVSYTHLTLPTN